MRGRTRVPMGSPRPEPGRCAARCLPDSHPRGTDHDETTPGVRRCRAPCRFGRGVGASADAGFPRRGKSHGCAARRQQPEDRNVRPAAGGNPAGRPRAGPRDNRRSSVLTEENGARDGQRRRRQDAGRRGEEIGLREQHSVFAKNEAAKRGGLIANRTVLPRYFGGALKIPAVIRITASVPSLRCQCTVVPGSPVVSPA